MSVSLYNRANPSQGPFEGGVPTEVSIEMSTPSSDLRLQIDRVDCVRDKLFVLARVYEEDSEATASNCAIGRAAAKMTVALPEGTDPASLKVAHYVLNCDWNWGQRPDITRIETEDQYETAVCIEYAWTYARNATSAVDKEVERIQSDPEFQANPKQYVLQMIVERGDSQEFRMPDDRVLDILRRTYVDNK